MNEAANDKTPWRHLGIPPDRWLRSAAEQFVFSPDHIVCSSMPYQCGMFGWASGVYFLITDDGEIAYVGMSKCVDDRIQTHIDRGRQFSRVWAVIGMPDIFLGDLETFYIHAINPRLNYRKLPLCNAFSRVFDRVVAGEIWDGWAIPIHEPDLIEPAA